MQVVVYIYIKLINERLAQKPAIAIAIMNSLPDKVVAVSVLGSLRLAQPSAFSAHSSRLLVVR